MFHMGEALQSASMLTIQTTPFKKFAKQAFLTLHIQLHTCIINIPLNARIGDVTYIYRQALRRLLRLSRPNMGRLNVLPVCPQVRHCHKDSSAA